MVVVAFCVLVMGLRHVALDLCRRVTGAFPVALELLLAAVRVEAGAPAGSFRPPDPDLGGIISDLGDAGVLVVGSQQRFVQVLDVALIVGVRLCPVQGLKSHG